MSATLTILALWLVGSIALGLLIGPVIRWGLHDDPPDEIHPMPSGSMERASTGVSS